jgi:cytochrome c oxidase subunit 1
VKFFNWIGTMWRGSITLRDPMLFALGFLTTFLFGGLTGVILASPPLDFQVSDTYFVVAHFHYVLFGTVVFAMFAGLLLLVAEVDRQDAGRASGASCTSGCCSRLPPDVPGAALAGAEGMQRRIADYLPRRASHC